MKSNIYCKKAGISILFFLIFNLCLIHFSIAQQPTDGGRFTIENYYKIKWGFADEFINLWKANHYPMLKKAMKKEDIISVTAEKPKVHSGEDTRWDFRVIIVFKNNEKAFDENLTEQYKKSIYPDLDKLKKDEQHRFELVIAHWDIMTEKIPVE